MTFDYQSEGHMKKAVVVQHVQIEVESNFDDFTFHLEKALGVLMPSALYAFGATPASMVSYLNSTRMEKGLILFNVLAQADLTKKEFAGKIKQYQIGNQKIMHSMIRHHAGTALYTPMHLLVYETVYGKAVVEYDLPSSLFAQFDNSNILLDSLTLENDLTTLLQAAERGLDANFN